MLTELYLLLCGHEFQGNEMTVLLDVILALVGNSKLLGFPFQTTGKNHETRVVT
jgi:predicted alpha/beta-hydrolase family hydrolase